MRNISDQENTDDNDEELIKVDSLLRLFGFLKPHIPKLILVFIMTVLLTGITMLIPQVAGEIVDSAINQIGQNDLNRISLYLISLIFIMAILGFCAAFYSGYIGSKFLLEMREKLFEHIMFLSLGFFQKRQSGELNARIMTNLKTIQQLLTIEVPAGLQSLLLLIGIIVILFYISVKLTLIALATCLPVILISVYFGMRLESSFLKVNDKLADSSASVEEVIRGITTVQSFGQEKQESTRYKGLLKRLFSEEITLIKTSGYYNALLDFFGYAAIAMVLWYGGQLIFNNQLSIGELTAALMYMLMFAFSIPTLGNFYKDLKELSAVSHRIFQILDEKPTVMDLGESTLCEADKLNIKLSDVSFCYEGNDNRETLSSISMEINEGDKVAIVGPTGSGKTTIFKLLLRFYDLNSGQIEINSKLLPEYSLASLRNLFGLVSQDIFLFSGTILENIIYGNSEASIEDVDKTIKAIGAADFIGSLKNGLHEQVGVGGTKLSGGQKQLIGIARVYLKNPKVLLLDEATSSLDSESEEKIQKCLKKLKEDRTSIVIAHRLATVIESDKIILLQNGKIESIGSHDYLKRNSELYSKYWQWQSRDIESSKDALLVK